MTKRTIPTCGCWELKPVYKNAMPEYWRPLNEHFDAEYWRWWWSHCPECGAKAKEVEE